MVPAARHHPARRRRRPGCAPQHTTPTPANTARSATRVRPEKHGVRARPHLRGGVLPGQPPHRGPSGPRPAAVTARAGQPGRPRLTTPAQHRRRQIGQHHHPGLPRRRRRQQPRPVPRPADHHHLQMRPDRGRPQPRHQQRRTRRQPRGHRGQLRVRAPAPPPPGHRRARRQRPQIHHRQRAPGQHRPRSAPTPPADTNPPHRPAPPAPAPHPAPPPSRSPPGPAADASSPHRGLYFSVRLYATSDGIAATRAGPGHPPARHTHRPDPPVTAGTAGHAPSPACGTCARSPPFSVSHASAGHVSRTHREVNQRPRPRPPPPPPTTPASPPPRHQPSATRKAPR